jgi:putative Holliday junction resolvase
MTADAPIPAGRVAGVDYGRRRIGIAVCDRQWILASPLCVRQTSGDRAADAAFFRSLVADEELVGFVVGLPVHADGTASDMSREVERFAAWLRGETGVPVALHDERYSSREAATMLSGVGLTRGRKKERSDAVAAQVVLAAWLEAQAAGGPGRAPEPLEG